jgi:hypothetical protein
MERGRKKRTNIRKKVVRAPAIDAQTIRRRILLTGGSADVSRTAAAAGFAGAAARGGALTAVALAGVI